MGFFRGGLLAVSCALLFISLILFLSVYTLKNSTEYETIQEKVSEQIMNLPDNLSEYVEGENSLQEKGIKIRTEANRTVPVMTESCKISEEYVFQFEGQTIALNCSMDKGENLIALRITEEFIKSTYYKEYSCGFWSCLIKGDSTYFLISQKANDYWAGKSNIFLITTLILLSSIFILTEQRANGLIVSGGAIILSSLSLLKIQGLIYRLIFSKNLKGTSPLRETIFSQATTTFALAITLGIVAICAGIFLRFFYTDFTKKKFSKEDVKEIIKEEKANTQNTNQQKNINKKISKN